MKREAQTENENKNMDTKECERSRRAGRGMKS